MPSKTKDKEVFTVCKVYRGLRVIEVWGRKETKVWWPNSWILSGLFRPHPRKPINPYACLACQRVCKKRADPEINILKYYPKREGFCLLLTMYSETDTAQHLRQTTQHMAVFIDLLEASRCRCKGGVINEQQMKGSRRLRGKALWNYQSWGKMNQRNVSMATHSPPDLTFCPLNVHGISTTGIVLNLGFPDSRNLQLVTTLHSKE